MPYRILFVCTGNICRSPYAEFRLRQMLDGCAIQVASAGTHAVVGAPMSEYSADVLGAVGCPGGGHVGRQLAKAMVLESNLVLTMTREHRSSVVKLAPRALRTAFTLRELGRLLPEMDPSIPLESLAEALRGMRGRSPAGDGDDVVDPIGQPMEAYLQMQAEIDPPLAGLAEYVRSATTSR